MKIFHPDITVGVPDPAWLELHSRLVAAVRSFLDEQGLAGSAAFYGSCGAGSITFLRCGHGCYLASDLDLVVGEPLSPARLAELTAGLNAIAGKVLGSFWCPSSKISIKVTDAEFQRKCEYDSLMRAIRATRLPVNHGARGHGPPGGSIVFPYALPYAAYRWLLWAGRGPACNASALYELAKGIMRNAYPEEQVGPGAGVPNVLFENNLRDFVREHVGSFAGVVGAAGAAWISEWLGEGILAGVSRDRRAGMIDVFSRYIAKQMPESIVAGKLGSLDSADGWDMGLRSGEVRFTRDHSRWARFYAELQAVIRGALGDLSYELEHVGSTAVAGIRAKPIVDIAIGLHDAEDFEAVRSGLESTGLCYRGCREDSGGHIFDLVRDGLALCYVHVVPVDGVQWERYVVFRDYLNESPSARERYEAVKVELAERHPNERKVYTAGKRWMITQLVEEAKARHPV